MLKSHKNLNCYNGFYIFTNITYNNIKAFKIIMEEIISSITTNIISNFDFTFCIIINLATYIIIKAITEYKSTIKFTTWNKRLIFLIVSIIISIIYYIIGSDVKIIFNSFILAPVSWSWIFKPICNKFNIGYNDKSK